MAVTLAVADAPVRRVHLQLGPGGGCAAPGRGVSRALMWPRMAGQIYVNPSCSKCRTALAILDERNVAGGRGAVSRRPPSVADLKD